MKLKSLFAGLAAVALLLAGCSQQSAKEEENTGSSPSVAENYGPVTVDACGIKSTLEAPPERIIFMNSTGMPSLVELGALDRVVGRIGVVETSTYSGETLEAINNLHVIQATQSGGGHNQVSTEALLELRPDLFIASATSDADMDKLQQAGVAIYIPKTYCGYGSNEEASFEFVYEEVRTVGAILGMDDKAEEVVKDLEERVSQFNAADHEGTAAAVFVSPGETTFWGYGANAMSHVQMTAIGLTNVYKDSPDRVFKLNMESLLEENPDYVIVLYQNDEEGAMQTFMAAHGAESLKAAKENKVVPFKFSLTDPPSPLSVDGLEKLAEAIDEVES